MIKQRFSILIAVTILSTVRSLGQVVYEPYTFTTLAGLAGNTGAADGTGNAARFSGPNSLAVDHAGNVYVADTHNNAVRMVTSLGVVTTLAGTGALGSIDGTGSTARFYSPTGAAVDNAGNVYVADSGNHTIRKLTPVSTNWMVTTLAGLAGRVGSTDGTAGDARFNQPIGVALDSSGNVYVADYGNATLRKIAPEGTNWVVTTLAGLAHNSGSTDGIGNAARFSSLQSVSTGEADNLYVADGDTIRKITPAGVVTTLAGQPGVKGSVDGTGNAALFNSPYGAGADSAGNVFVADTFNNTVRKVTPTGVVTTVAGLSGVKGGADGAANVARFYYLSGLAVDNAGNLYVADTANSTIRKGYRYPPIVLIGSGLAFGFKDGKFGFNVAGDLGQVVVVETSTDLMNWHPIWTNTLSSKVTFTDPQTAGTGSQFYRARLP